MAQYRIETINESDYILELMFKAQSRLFKKIFNKAKTKLKRKHNLSVNGEIEEIKEFKIPDNQIKLIQMAIKGEINKISNQTKQDGIELLNYNVISATFKQDIDGNFWNIFINVGGIYSDKRNDKKS